MLASEAATLLGFCAAYDQRRVGEADARAWAEALDERVTFADARAAVVAFYAEVAERRIMPADINRRAKDMRAARMQLRWWEKPEASPEIESGAQEVDPGVGLAWLKACLRMRAEGGRTPAEIDQLACEETGFPWHPEKYDAEGNRLDRPAA